MLQFWGMNFIIGFTSVAIILAYFYFGIRIAIRCIVFPWELKLNRALLKKSVDELNNLDVDALRCELGWDTFFGRVKFFAAAHQLEDLYVHLSFYNGSWRYKFVV